MHKTRGRQENDILYNIQHISEPNNANERLQCTLHIPAVNDRYILRFPQKICQDLSLTYSQTKLIVWDMSLMTMAYMPN